MLVGMETTGEDASVGSLIEDAKGKHSVSRPPSPWISVIKEDEQHIKIKRDFGGAENVTS